MANGLFASQRYSTVVLFIAAPNTKPNTSDFAVFFRPVRDLLEYARTGSRSYTSCSPILWQIMPSQTFLSLNLCGLHPYYCIRQTGWSFSTSVLQSLDGTADDFYELGSFSYDGFRETAEDRSFFQSHPPFLETPKDSPTSS
jgi:hypothetical protein